MVGQALSKVCVAEADQVLAYTRSQLDIADRDRVQSILATEHPDVVINCAAWTDVDACESDPQRAHNANAAGPENLALASRSIGAGFLTISTDYVFDGRKEGFYTQRDQPNPESVYALAKLEGERRAQQAYARSIIVRSGFIFGAGGRNFLSTIIERAQKGERLLAINDAYGTPTYAPDLAAQLRVLAQRDLPGAYHVVNSGAGASYEEFLWAALDDAGITNAEVKTVSSQSLTRPAPRPQNSRLHCLLSEAIGLPPLQSWRDGVREFAALQGRPEITARS
jgi:dTDP-4-dehydrorhamnose reductase